MTTRRTTFRILMLAMLSFGLVMAAWPLVASLQPDARSRASAQLAIPLAETLEGQDYIETTHFGELHVNRIGGIHAVVVDTYPNGYVLPVGTNSFYSGCAEFKLVGDEYRCTSTVRTPDDLAWLAWQVNGASVDPTRARDLHRFKAWQASDNIIVELDPHIE